MRFQEKSFLLLAVMSGAFGYASISVGPMMTNTGVQPIPAVLGALGGLFGFQALSEGLERLARFCEWLSTLRPDGKSGTAHWATWWAIRKEISKAGEGTFWGLRRGRCFSPSLFVDFESNAMSVAPAGSGKGICAVVPAGLAIKSSKVFADFKGELACLLKAPLEARGELVVKLNPGGLWSEQLGSSDSLNPHDLIADDLHRPGGLRDVPDDLREEAMQILPEPSDQESENSYWREGGRNLISFGSLAEVMVDEYDATLSSVALMLEDRSELEKTARWIAGLNMDGTPLAEGPMPIEKTEWAQKHSKEDLEEFCKWVRARAKSVVALLSADDSRTFDSFLSGAQQALAPFAFGRLAPAMGRSTFKLSDLKERAVSLFIIADASRMEAYRPYIGLIQWCCMTAIKRHEKKSAPVYFILDEATNYKINGLDSLLTWGRSYGLRLYLVFQDLSAFARVYGRHALETLLSETEVKQFLPGQQSQSTRELIAKLLGEQSIMAGSFSAGKEGVSANRSDSARPLMTPDEIRRSPYGLLFVRRCAPIQIEPISYAEIHPWRKQVGINPFHGEPFLKRIRLRLGRRA